MTRGDAAVIAYKMFYTDHYYTCKNGPGTYKNDEMAKEVKEDCYQKKSGFAQAIKDLFK